MLCKEAKSKYIFIRKKFAVTFYIPSIHRIYNFVVFLVLKTAKDLFSLYKLIAYSNDCFSLLFTDIFEIIFGF